MDLASVQFFIDVVRHGSFAAVAREHNIDPSAVSRAIASLEEALGIRLFQRTTRQLKPTEAGMLYFERMAPLIEEMHQASAAAADLSAKPRGILRVNAAVAFGLRGIVPLLPQFSADYPELTVDLQLTDAIVDLYAERIDLAVRLGALADSSLIAQPLMPFTHVVCANADYLVRHGQPADTAELSGHNCLLASMASERGRWTFIDTEGGRSEAQVHGRIVITNPLALQQCANAGMGMALLSRWLVRDDLAAGRLIDVFPQYKVSDCDFKAAAWLIYPSRAYLPLKVRVFIDALKAGIVA